jgi:hypothetical protein
MKIKAVQHLSQGSDQEDKRKHLELIQGVISRMGGNLFYLRGWSVTLAAGLLAIFTSQKEVNDLKLFPLFLLGAVTLMFWVYDGYFLAQERRYRALYNKVRETPYEDIDYSMDTREFASQKKNTVVYCLISKTLWPFYSFLLGVTACLLLITAQG